MDQGHRVEKLNNLSIPFQCAMQRAFKKNRTHFIIALFSLFSLSRNSRL
jgi:hypothetical protein